MAQPCVIDAQNLGKRFDHRWIFRHVSFSVAGGDRVAMIGPSSQGKSTILKLIAGLCRPDEGELRVATTDVGMLFQRNALFDSLSVEDNLLFTLKESRGISGHEARTQARELLKAVGLDGAEEKAPSQISGGMQKRLGIARALIARPDLILYDDPTAGLDPVTSRMIADLILEFQKKWNSTLIAVTSDMQRAYQLANRIFLLDDGQLIEAGTPAETKAAKDPRVRAFLYGAIA